MRTVALSVLGQEIINEILVSRSCTRPDGVRDIFLEIVTQAVYYLLRRIAAYIVLLTEGGNNIVVFHRDKAAFVVYLLLFGSDLS